MECEWVSASSGLRGRNKERATSATSSAFKPIASVPLCFHLNETSRRTSRVLTGGQYHVLASIAAQFDWRRLRSLLRFASGLCLLVNRYIFQKEPLGDPEKRRGSTVGSHVVAYQPFLSVRRVHP